MWHNRFHLNEPQDFYNNALWTEETDVEICEHNQHKISALIPTVKHGGGGLVVWACSTDTGHVPPAVILSTMSSFVVQRTLEPNKNVGKQSGPKFLHNSERHIK